MTRMSRFATVTTAASLAAAALLAPAAAHAAPSVPATMEAVVENSCTVTGGELSWGVKESFRSYISGTIANGGWELTDVSYASPQFTWSGATGEIDADTGEGTVSFNGSIQFTGHDGVLNLLIANPTVEIMGDGTARLLLDTTSNNVQGELVVDEQQASLGKIEGIQASDPTSGEYAFGGAPAVLTADGAAAFGDFYASGDPLDAVTLSLQLAQCAAGAGTDAGAGSEEAASEEVVLISEQDAGVPWLPIIIGGVAVVVIGVTAALLLAGRKKASPAPQAPEQP